MSKLILFNYLTINYGNIKHTYFFILYFHLHVFVSCDLYFYIRNILVRYTNEWGDIFLLYGNVNALPCLGKLEFYTINVLFQKLIVIFTEIAM